MPEIKNSSNNKDVFNSTFEASKNRVWIEVLLKDLDANTLKMLDEIKKRKDDIANKFMALNSVRVISLKLLYV